MARTRANAGFRRIFYGILTVAGLFGLSGLTACSHTVLTTSFSRMTYPPILRQVSAIGLRSENYRGQGVRIGLISTGVVNYSALTHADILPKGIVRFGDKEATGEEGGWLLQVIHKIAPQAKLADCYYKLGVAACEERLIRKFHANVVVLDLGRRSTSFKYSEIVPALEKLHRTYPGVLLFSASDNFAGNFYRGKWQPVSWILNDKGVLAQDFGSSVKEPSRPYNFFRTWKGVFQIQVRGHVFVIGAKSHCSWLPLRLVLLNRHNQVIAGTGMGDGAKDCNELKLIVNSKQYPAISHETVYRVALVAPPSLKWTKFRVRLQGLAVAHAKPHSRRSSLGHEIDYKLQEFKWRYATSDTTGGETGPVSSTGYLTVVPLDPYTAFHGLYEREGYAGIGPACYLRPQGGVSRSNRILCYRQPLLGAPDLVTVAKAAHNAQGLRHELFTGSSDAVAVVAGSAALLLSAGISALRIPHLLEQTARRQPSVRSWSPLYGYGQIDVDAAAKMAGVLLDYASSGAEMPPSSSTADGRQAEVVTHRKKMNQLANAAEAGKASAMWWLGTALEEGEYYSAGDVWAALVWWQRAAHRGYPAAFCSLANVYAAPNGFSTEPPVPYRPRLALALFETCLELGGALREKPGSIEKLQSDLSKQEIESAKELAQRLAHDPRRYLPSLNYEYVPN